MPFITEGRVWRFGDNINTDLINPNIAFRLSEAEQLKYVFSANRPGWAEQVCNGDLIVAGANFGMGSGRPSGQLLYGCGIRGIIAESINGLCLRNCVVAALPAIECQGVSTFFTEGDAARVDFASGFVENLTTGRQLQGRGMPSVLLETIVAGGIIPMLVREGYVEPPDK